MSGPALRQLHAHHSIHQGTYTEAEEIMSFLRQLYSQESMEKAFELANILVEHWETRTLAHAEAEEDGFYREKLQENPDLLETITKLKRDHELVGILVQEIKMLLADEGISQVILSKFDAVFAIVEIHSREEERLLLSN